METKKLTPKQKATEIDRICNKINAYKKEKREEINALESEIKRIKKESQQTIEYMIDYEAKKKGVSKVIVETILKDKQFAEL